VVTKGIVQILFNTLTLSITTTKLNLSCDRTKV
jgi:hypothetical protein